MMTLRPLAFLLSLACLASTANAQSSWPRFRGSDGSGVPDAKGLPDVWDRTTNVVWRRDVPGRGWSSPVVWEKRVLLTTAVSAGPIEDAKKGLYFGGNRKDPSPHAHRWVVLCLDADTGKTLWDSEAHKATPTTPLHVKNTYASETPVTDGERVYAYFGNLGIFAYDMDGRALWSVPMKPHTTRYDWGTAASPLLHDGRLYVVNDNEEDSFILALDAATGKEVWRVARDEKSNWSTPFAWVTAERTEIVTTGSGKVRSYGLDGTLLWELDGMSSIVIPTPFTAHDLLFIASGYVMDPLKPVYAIRPGAKGDITLPEDETKSEFIAWCDRDAGPYNPTNIVYGDYHYTLFDRGFIGVHEARTGKQIYKKRRISDEANAFTASPWAYDGKLFCLSEDGDTFVLRAGPEFELIRVNSLGEMCMATPAIAGGRLFIRTISGLYCIGGAGTSATPAAKE